MDRGAWQATVYGVTSVGHAPWKERYDKRRQHIKKQRHHFADKGPYSQIYGFSSSHVQMWELDHKEGRALKNWCFWTVMQKKTWIFIGSPDAEAEVTGLPDAKSRLIGKDCNAGKDWGQEEKGVTEDMVGWHHQFDGHQFEQTLGDSEGQGSLACCSPWGHKALNTTWQLNNEGSIMQLGAEANRTFSMSQLWVSL